MDKFAAPRIVHQQIAVTKGSEQAFWLMLQLGQRMNQLHTPSEYRSVLPQLQEMMAVAPDDPDTVHAVANTALVIYAWAESPEGLVQLFPLFRPHRQGLLRDVSIRGNLAILMAKKRRWYSVYRNTTLTRNLFDELPEAKRSGGQGYLHFNYARRAVATVALGWYDQAERDITAARAMRDARPPGYFQPDFLALAEAALAHARGLYQEARAALQIATNAPSRRYKRPPWVEVDFLLMAARIARSEGNLSSFHHFCQQARALCAEHDMPLSAATVEAVANGAEY